MSVPETPGEDTVEVDVKRLKLGLSPRFGEQDLDHARALAFRLDDCPPILVERSTSTVIDGVHRVVAARMLNRRTVRVRYFEGTREEAFVEAIKANVTHGKPLTLAEREAAALKLLGVHSDWSNRLVGDICGLSDKTVGRLRKTTAERPQLSVRMGRDGRHRPIDSDTLRKQIATALKAKPDARPEEVAQRLSTSPSTVRDVRRRIQTGQSPMRSTRAVDPEQPGRPTFPRKEDRRSVSASVDWQADRAILSLANGNELAEWLQQTRIRPDQWEGLVAEIPIGRIPQLIEEAEARSLEWTRFAAALEARARDLNRRN
jgi:ParB-like chromosome segregation protein Spo0J